MKHVWEELNKGKPGFTNQRVRRCVRCGATQSQDIELGDNKNNKWSPIKVPKCHAPVVYSDPATHSDADEIDDSPVVRRKKKTMALGQYWAGVLVSGAGETKHTGFTFLLVYREDFSKYVDGTLTVVGSRWLARKIIDEVDNWVPQVFWFDEKGVAGLDDDGTHFFLTRKRHKKWSIDWWWADDVDGSGRHKTTPVLCEKENTKQGEQK